MGARNCYRRIYILQQETMAVSLREDTKLRKPNLGFQKEQLSRASLSRKTSSRYINYLEDIAELVHTVACSMRRVATGHIEEHYNFTFSIKITSEHST